MPIYANDETGYINWVREHPLGYVLVSHNPPSAKYITLHRADCYYINPAKALHKDNWTKLYIKVCGTSFGDIELWAEGNLKAGKLVLPLCKSCVNAGRM